MIRRLLPLAVALVGVLAPRAADPPPADPTPAARSAPAPDVASSAPVVPGATDAPADGVVQAWVTTADGQRLLAREPDGALAPVSDTEPVPGDATVVVYADDLHQRCSASVRRSLTARRT